MIASILPLLLMQVGPFPTVGKMPGVPDELRDRPPRESNEVKARPASPLPRHTQLTECVALTASDPQAALNRAQAWRETANSDLELAQSAHCLGLALVKLERFDDARRIFEVASAEAPDTNPAYSARLAAMAGNAALAEGKPATAEPLFATAAAHAQTAGDPKLTASLLADRARALVALDRLAEAATALSEARTDDPASAQIWLLSATLARRQQQLTEAQKYIEQAAVLAPRDPAIGLEAGVIAALSGRTEDARRSFASVVEVAPGSEEGTKAKAYLEQLKP